MRFRSRQDRSLLMDFSSEALDSSDELGGSKVDFSHHAFGWRGLERMDDRQARRGLICEGVSDCENLDLPNS